MDESQDAALRSQARKRYEGGRVRCAVLCAAPTLGIGLLAVMCGASVLTAVLWSVAAFVWVAGARWARNVWGEGALTGVSFSLVPLAAAGWLSLEGHTCSMSTCQLVCATLGVAGGAIWGLLAARRSVRWGRGGLGFAAGGAIVVALIGCVTLSVGSVAGVMVGLLGGLLAVAARSVLARA